MYHRKINSKKCGKFWKLDMPKEFHFPKCPCKILPLWERTSKYTMKTLGAFHKLVWTRRRVSINQIGKKNWNLDLKFFLRTGIRQSNKVIVPKFPPSPLLPTHKKKRVALVQPLIVCMEILFLKLARNRMGTHWQQEKIWKKILSPPKIKKKKKQSTLSAWLGLPIDCMKFILPKEFVTIFGVG